MQAFVSPKRKRQQRRKRNEENNNQSTYLLIASNDPFSCVYLDSLPLTCWKRAHQQLRRPNDEYEGEDEEIMIAVNFKCNNILYGTMSVPSPSPSPLRASQQYSIVGIDDFHRMCARCAPMFAHISSIRQRWIYCRRICFLL